MTFRQRWAPALFSRFRAREREAKKSAKARRKKNAKKAKAPSAKEKKREFALFPPPTVETRFQSPKPLGRGKCKGLERDVQFSMLKRQIGTNTREETQERDIGEETEGKRQRGRTQG